MKYTGHSDFKKSPFLKVRDTVGNWAVIGVLTDGRDVTGKGTFFDVELWDMGGGTEVSLKDANGVPQPYEPAKGETVALLAPSGLTRSLRQVFAVLGKGGKVKITYQGKKPKKTKFGMKDTHFFDVEDI